LVKDGLSTLMPVHIGMPTLPYDRQEKGVEQSKMDLGADILHELRTPLHSIQGFVRLILEGKVPDPETQRQFLTIVERESQRLNNLVDELLDAFATGSGPKAIKNECVSMRYVILGTILKLGGLAAEKEITIDTDLDDTLPAVEGDEQALSQVVTNLLHNAIKFSPQGSKITVRANKMDSKLLTQVTDEGVGITREIIPNLFEKFYRGHSSMMPDAYGTGLGLHICKQIVGAHGGQIWVESKPGTGSTFSFTIPLPQSELATSGEARRGKSHDREDPDHRR
jgi:signal transduction histidine kinase